MSALDVSVLIVSWNTCALTLDCLAALTASIDDQTRYEVIVVDNGSRDGSPSALAGCNGIRLIANPENRGYAAAVNQAHAAAQGELLLLLNSDVHLAPGSLSALVRFLRAHPEAAGVAPLYRHPDGSFQAHYHRLPTLATALGLATGLRRLPPIARRLRTYSMHEDDFSSPRPVPQPSAACLLLRRACLSGQVFDERYPLFFNDVDLARRLAMSGRALWVAPEAVAVHELGGSTKLLTEAARTRQHLGSLVRYLQADGRRRPVRAFRLLVAADWLVRRVVKGSSALGFHDLRRALAGDPGPLPDEDRRSWVVYAAAIPWAGGGQRQHEVARQLAQTRRVLFVEPPGLLPRWRMAVEEMAPSLWRARPPTLLPLGRVLPPANVLNRRFAARRLRHWLADRPGARVLLIDEDLAAPAAGRLGETARVYDAADLDWTFTRRWNRPHLKRALERAVRSADVVLVSSTALIGTLPANGTQPVELLNACDPDHFCPDGPRADALASISPPRLGYVGAIDGRAFDAALVAEVAARRPEWSFVLAGPYRPPARRRLRGLANVHLLGPVPYREVPALVRGFDVCLIPYRAGELASYAHPKKFFEYLAAGKPVVAAPLPALRVLDAPHHSAETPEEFIAAVEAALTEGPRADLVEQRRAVAAANSWDARGDRLRVLLDRLERRAG